MADRPFDTIVIGAGVAGLGAAALLARDHGQRVLVLERAPFIGGRALSYVGRGNRVYADGIEMDAQAFRKSLALAQCRLGKCTPDIDTIFARGLLDGRTFEAGGHGLFWGNKGRIGHLMQHLGVDHRLPLNRGFAFVRWHGEGTPGTLFQVGKGKPYPWMSEAGYAATMTQLRAMSQLTFADLAEAMKVSLRSWFEQRQLHPEAYEYLKVLAASQTGQAEPGMTPAGDFLGYMAIAKDINMNLVSGSVATAEEPGTIAFPQHFEQVLLAHGGEVRRGTPVQRVIIDRGRVRGVQIKAGGRDHEPHSIAADNVICTIPPKHIFTVLPRDPFPADWVNLLEQKFWGAGFLTGWCGTRRSLWESAGIADSSFVYMPGILREGYIGAVDIVMGEFTAWGEHRARRAPAGKHDFLFSTALTDAEMRDQSKVSRVIETCEAWARAQFPTFDEDVEFIIWTPSPEAYGLWRPIGEDRPDVKSPWVEGLYFAGDQYGARLWGGGIDGAALSAVLCVDRMMGANQEEEIFPAYHRGIPSITAFR